jgi:acetyl-CoA C-acetyltransferase
MTDIIIAGISQTRVEELWDISLRSLAARAMLGAIRDAGGLKPTALYVGNFLGSMVSHQANLGSLLADNIALEGMEGVTVEAADASGAAAFRLAYLAVLSGYVDVALVVGVEKYTDAVGDEVDRKINMALDYDYEGVPGLTPATQAGLLMRRYLDQYHLPADALAGFSFTAHANAVNNPNALFRRAIERDAYARVEKNNETLNLYDAAPYADGAAALILTRPELVPAGVTHPLVRVIGSSVVTDTLALHDRPDPLAFQAAAYSVERACRQAGILPQDVDLFELWDSYSIYAALSLEAAGFATRGEGWKLADGKKMPILTMGGNKARGYPLGAAGAYQLVEAALQLRGEAGGCQVKGARRALVQSLGGPASTAVTHVLERMKDA